MKSPQTNWIPESWAIAPPKAILLRIDAGCVPGLSFGHLYRAMTFAEWVSSHLGTRCHFLVNEDTDCHRLLEASSFNYQSVTTNHSLDQDAQQTLEVAKKEKVDWLYFDLPYADYPHSLFSTLSEAGIQSFYVDDNNFIVPPVAIYSNSSILAERHIKKPAPNTTLLLGPSKLIFSRQTSSVRPKTFGPENVPEVCITFGGSDPTGLTNDVVTTLLAHSDIEARYRVITGPGFQSPNVLGQLLSGHHNFLHEHSPDMLHPLLELADIVICNGGRTLYECYNLGTPALPISSITHEAEAIRGFIDAKLVSVGLTAFNASKLIDGLQQLLRTL